MSIFLSTINSVAVSLFGSILSASFCQAADTPQSRRIFGCCMAVLPLLQVGGISIWGALVHRQLYPLFAHLPLLLLLWFLTGKLLWPMISVLAPICAVSFGGGWRC